MLGQHILTQAEFAGCDLLAAGCYDFSLVGRQGLGRLVDFFKELSTLTYAHVFVDSSPMFAPMQELCLRVCDTVLIPVQPRYSSIEGVRFLMQSIYRAEVERRRSLRVGVVVNHRHIPSTADLAIERRLRAKLANLVYPRAIPFSYWFYRCAESGQNLLVRGRGPVVDAIHQLAAQFLERLQVGGEESAHSQDCLPTQDCCFYP